MVLVVIVVMLCLAFAVLLGSRKLCAKGATHALPVTASELLWELEQERWVLAEKVLDAQAGWEERPTLPGISPSHQPSTAIQPAQTPPPTPGPNSPVPAPPACEAPAPPLPQQWRCQWSSAAAAAARGEALRFALRRRRRR